MGMGSKGPLLNMKGVKRDISGLHRLGACTDFIAFEG